MKDLRTRTITAIAIIVCIIPILYFGGIAMDIMCGLLTLGASYELEKMYLSKHEKTAFTFVDVALAIISFLSIIISVRMDMFHLFIAFACCLFLIEGTMLVFSKKSNLETVGRSLLSIFYPSIGFAALDSIRNMQTNLFRGGLFVVVYVMAVCMMTDMFAYLFGCKIGKHKMCPEISPKKSWEGFVMGLVLGTVIGSALGILSGVGTVLFENLQPMWQVICMVLVTVALSLVEVVGDLVASKFKRGYGIKDYSNIFPGHGGVLDRFDSYIFASAALMLFLLI